MKADGPDHPKTLQLVATLDRPLPFIVGTLDLLWIFTARYADDGVVGRFPDDLIERRCGWDGAEGALITALKAVGYLDREPETERLLVHDWHDHAPEYVKKRLRRRAVAAESRASWRVPPAAADVRPEGGQRPALPRQGKANQGKANQLPGGRCSMPKPLPLAATEKLQAWGKTAGYDFVQILAAVKAVRAWHQAEGSAIAARHRTIRGWVQTVQNSLAKGWWSDYAPPASEPPKPAPGSTNSEEWRETRNALKRQVDGERAERERRFSEGSEPSPPVCFECGLPFNAEGNCGCPRDGG